MTPIAARSLLGKVSAALRERFPTSKKSSARRSYPIYSEGVQVKMRGSYVEVSYYVPGPMFDATVLNTQETKTAEVAALLEQRFVVHRANVFTIIVKGVKEEKSFFETWHEVIKDSSGIG